MAVYVRFRLGRARFKQARFVRLAEQVLTEAGESESELSIELVGDRRMRRLNLTDPKVIICSPRDGRSFLQNVGAGSRGHYAYSLTG